MKWSIYNISDLSKEGNFLLYNYSTDKILILLPELYSIVKKYKNNADGINHIHPELYEILCKNGFIVDVNLNEAEIIEQKIIKNLSSTNILYLTINPTLDSNLRCWYCYEEHTQNCYMTNETIERIIKLVGKKASDENLHTIYLGFFGGEPLLKANKIALPLIQKIKNICNIHKKKLKLNFTTNGVLLSKDLADKLAETGLKVHFQIPFDGGHLLHNKTKFTSNGNGTFHHIIKNIEYGLSKGFDFTIRCNYTNENIESFIELADEMSKLTHYGENRIRFSLQKVWQEKYSDILMRKVTKLKLYLKEKSLISKFAIDDIPNHCYADYKSSIIINYNGDIFKCTARSFNHHERIGILENDGNITETERAKLYNINRFRPQCRSCKLLPICVICIQKKIENNTCEIKKEDIDCQLRMKLMAVIEKYI